jgi:hypothetical protein
MRFELVNRFTGYSHFVRTSNCNTLMITVTITHEITSSTLLTIQLPSEFSSGDGFSAVTECLMFNSLTAWILWVWVLYYQQLAVSLGIKCPSGAYDKFFVPVRQLQVCWCGALSLTRGRVCCLHLQLAVTSAVILRSESCGTCDHILLSQIWDFPFRYLLRLAGLRCRYLTPQAALYFVALREPNIDPESFGLAWSPYITLQPTSFVIPFPTVNVIAFLHCCTFSNSLPWISALNS